MSQPPFALTSTNSCGAISEAASAFSEPDKPVPTRPRPATEHSFMNSLRSMVLASSLVDESVVGDEIGADGHPRANHVFVVVHHLLLRWVLLAGPRIGNRLTRTR